MKAKTLGDLKNYAAHLRDLVEKGHLCMAMGERFKNFELMQLYLVWGNYDDALDAIAEREPYRIDWSRYGK